MERTITFFFLILCTGRLHPQAVPGFEKLSIEQGLSNVSVYCLLQDRQGFIWVGTQGGLNRFDGYGFVSYQRDPANPYSLNDNFINCLLEDQSSIIWAGTRQGLSRFDKTSGHFSNYSSDSSDTQYLLFNHVTTLVENKAGNLWVGTKGGLGFFDVAKRQFRRIPLNAGGGGAAPTRINSLVLDEQGILWIGAESGLLRFDPLSGQSDNFSDIVRERLPPVLSLCNDGPGALWVGTTVGIYRFEKASSRLQSYPPQNGIMEQVTTIVKDSRGGLLVGTDRGIELLDPLTGAFLPFLMYNKTGNWYKPSRPQAILEDRDKTYWIAHIWDGVYHFDPSPRKFKHFYRKPGRSNAMPDNEVIGLFEDSRGNVWVGTGSDLSIMNPASGQFSTLFSQPSGMFKSVLEEKDGTIWAGTQFGAIRQAPGKAPVWYRYNRNDPQHGSPGATKIIFQDSQGFLWFGGGDGLFRHEPGSGFFQPFEITRIPADTNIVYHITEDQFSRLWVSTNNGLVRLDKTRKGIRHFTNDPLDPSSLCDNNVSCVVISKNGQVWVASYDGGLDKFDAEKENFTHYRRKDGLPDEKIWGMVEDDRGFLWLSTSRGLSRFDPRGSGARTFHNFDVTDGLQDYEFSMTSFNRGKKTDNLYFGGINGFNGFHPDSLQYNETPPSVVFTSFRYHPGSFEETDFKEIPGITAKSEVVLPYPAQAIVCEFAALNFRQSFKNQYAYRLDGVHQNWIDLGTKREVTFANLRPGRYTLLVKASNNDGFWNEKGACLHIVIRPPWWATWWAYLLYALAFGSIVWLFYKNQLRQRLQQQEALRLKELDDFKNRFFTNITHEFRTPLTVILGTSEQVESKVSDELKSKVKLIRRNGENLLRLINQILDLAKLESNTLKINYVQGDVLPYLRYVAESLHSLANAQNVMLRVESEEVKIVMDYDPERLLQIVYNLLSNAVKFTPSGGRVTLQANTDLAGFENLPSLNLSVSDAGAGIPPEDLPYIFDRFYQANNLEKAKAGGTGIGLALTKELVQAMGGVINVESEAGKGATFSVRLPITHEAGVASEQVSFSKGQASHPVTLERVENLGGNFPKGTPSEKLPPKLSVDSSQPANHLLIIEDNPDVVEYLAACLQEHYELDFAYNGRAGIEKALETVPDLIVSDVMMPEKDGFEVVETLKNDERTSHVPIVLLTAKADMESRIKGLKRGADAYLSKPFHQEELLVTLNNLLESRKKLQARYGKLEIGKSEIQESKLEITEDQASISQFPISDFQPDLEDAFLQKVRAIVEQNLADADFEMPHLERALGMSRSQIFRKMKALTGKSPSQFIRSIRLHHGKRMLQTTDLTVSEIAYNVGFATVKYFSDAFFEEFGERPTGARG